MRHAIEAPRASLREGWPHPPELLLSPSAASVDYQGVTLATHAMARVKERHERPLGWLRRQWCGLFRGHSLIRRSREGRFYFECLHCSWRSRDLT